MRYNPEFPIKMNFNEDETFAYQLLCIWIDLRQKFIPDYLHTPLPKNLKNLRNSLLFKQILKFVRDNRRRFKGFQFVIFMTAQLQILGKLHKEGKAVLIEASCLTGKSADARYAVWKKQIQAANKVTKITYEFVASNLEFDLKNTYESIKTFCKNDINFENYAKESSSILKFAILKKISPVYVLLSPWVKQLPTQLQNDLNDILNIETYKNFDLTNAMPMFNKFFKHESQ